MNLQAKLAQVRHARAARQQQAIEQVIYLRRLQAGDAVAWEQFVREWSPHLYRYLATNLRCVAATDEVVSTTLRMIVQAIHQVDRWMTLDTFVYRIAYRQVAAYGRRQGRAQVPWRYVLRDSQSSDGVDQALLALPAQLQQLLLLRYAVGLSVAEIAQVVGRSVPATEALLNQARRQFEAAFRRRARA
jgi:RNA polymerase sigma-70 factor, ECF subfamily